MPSMRSPEQPPQYFKPRINKKSEILDKKVSSKYQMSQTSRVSEMGEQKIPAPIGGKSAERPNLILQKGQEYKERVDKRRQEK